MDMRVAFAESTPAKPFVLLASLRGCPFCEFVRRSYLVPMNQEGRINAWQLSIDRNAPVIGFSGNSVAARNKATSLGVRTTPTVLFLGVGGKPLAEPLVGVVSSEFYGAVLDERLKAASKAT
jgi:thioredoxin-related protein